MCGRDAARKLTLKVDISQGSHDRFLRDQLYRESQLAIGWTEQKCKEMDEFAKENHTYHLSTKELVELKRKFFSDFFFCYSWFRLQSMAIHCNRRGCVDRYTSHVIFCHADCTIHFMHITLRGSSVCLRAFIPSSCHP